MALQQFDLGAVYDTLMRKQAVDSQVAGQQQQGQMNALQMARYQRENDLADKKQSILSGLSNPNLDAAGKQSILAQAYPELMAQQAFRERDIGRSEDGTMWDKHDGTILSTTSPLDGEAKPQTTSQAAPRPTLAPGGPVPMPAQRPYSDGVKSVENTTGNPNAQSPRSTATGDGQFTESTWLDMMNRKAPALTQGKSREEILAMRGDPELSAKMTDLYGQENQAYLEKNGVQATPALIYSAHHFGPDAAVKFAKASPDTPLTAILSPEAIKANPHLAELTVGQARANQERRFAGVGMPGQQPQPQQTADAPQSGDDGWLRVRNLKGAGIAQDAPPGMMWVGRRRPDGSIDTKVAPIPGSGGSVSNLTPEEVAQAGLPAGTVAQREASGKVTVLKEGEKPQTAKDVAEVERGWRSDFAKPITQARELTSQLGIIKDATARGNGTGDIAAITAFNKLLDPGAVVREADVNLTLQAQGVGDRLATWMANKKEGDILPPDLRVKMRELAEQVHATSNAYLRDGVMTYREAIEHGGGNFDRVLPPQMRKSLGWDDQPDPNAWQKVELPKDVTPGDKASASADHPALPPGFKVIGG